jgi:hypothetical protein
VAEVRLLLRQRNSELFPPVECYSHEEVLRVIPLGKAYLNKQKLFIHLWNEREKSIYQKMIEFHPENK